MSNLKERKSEEFNKLPRYKSGPLARPYKLRKSSSITGTPVRHETREEQRVRLQNMLDDGIKAQRNPNDGKFLPKESIEEQKTRLIENLNKGEEKQKKTRLTEIKPDAQPKKYLGFFKRLGLRSAASIFMIVSAQSYDMPTVSMSTTNNALSSPDTKILHAQRNDRHRNNAATANAAWKIKNDRLKSIPVYQDLKQHFKSAEEKTKIPQSFLALIVPHEARGYNIHAVNPDTKACGLMQIKPEFFNFVYYEYFGNRDGLVKKISRKEYVPAGSNTEEIDKNKKILASRCKWPGLNLASAGYNINVNMKNGLETVLKYREPTYADLYFIQVLGGKGADNYIQKPYADPLQWDHPISYYVPDEIINANPLVFKNKDGSIKTLIQTYDGAVERVTYTSLPKELWKPFKNQDTNNLNVPIPRT